MKPLVIGQPGNPHKIACNAKVTGSIGHFNKKKQASGALQRKTPAASRITSDWCGIFLTR